MKAINGKLDMSKSYKLVNVLYGKLDIDTACQCENCGNLISNIAVVEQVETGLKYNIGLDCMETITTMNPCEKTQAKNKINRIRNFIKKLRTEVKSILLVKYEKKEGYWFYGYKNECSENWSANWIIGGDYAKHQNLIESFNIPVFYENLTEKAM